MQRSPSQSYGVHTLCLPVSSTTTMHQRKTVQVTHWPFIASAQWTSESPSGVTETSHNHAVHESPAASAVEARDNDNSSTIIRAARLLPIRNSSRFNIAFSWI